jgi:hypothetical protein
MPPNALAIFTASSDLAAVAASAQLKADTKPTRCMRSEPIWRENSVSSRIITMRIKIGVEFGYV